MLLHTFHGFFDLVALQHNITAQGRIWLKTAIPFFWKVLKLD